MLDDNYTGFPLGKVETIAKPGRHSDGGGLYLAIETGEHARRAWVFMYREAPAAEGSLG
jgi:hypothetical protein